jgi:primase-polymerase (primpol)-like protein
MFLAMTSIQCIPDELTALPQWLIWRYETRQGKPTKAPYTTMGYRACVVNPEHWSTFEFALAAAARPKFADGIGFVFTGADPFCGIDLDNCYPSDAAECAPWAQGILERFSDTYSEVSPSGAGVKIWCRAKAPRCGRWGVEDGAIEVYDHSRFFTCTGRSAGILVVTDHQRDIERLVGNLDEDRGATLSRPIPDVIPQGQRHNALVSLAGSMWKRGMCAEAIEAALMTTNQRQCDPPYEPEHISKIVASMQRWPR